MARKRERLEVIHDILAVIRGRNNQIKPTRLLQLSNLSPQMFKDYMSELEKKGMVMTSEDGASKIYSLTDKGFKFLSEYRVIQDFVDNFGL